MKTMFTDSVIAQKFACKRTKTTHIVTQALAPHWDKKISELCQTETFSVMIDESNDKGDNKNFFKLCILVRVYNQTIRKIATQFVGIPTCNIGSSQSIFNCLNQVFIDREIPWSNCIGFASDNCNVMVGKNNSVLLTRVRQMNPNVFDVGCICHLANLCAQKAIKTIPLPVEDILIDVYFHFYHSSKRKEIYSSFQDFTETEPMKLLKHCSTRWLSLDRLLQQWPALKSYFQSHDESEKPGRIQRCTDSLTNDEMWLYYAFLDFVLPMLNDFNVNMFQAGESMVGFLHTEMVRLLRKLMGRFVLTKVITAHTDITKVDIRLPANMMIPKLLLHGWTAREFIADNEINPLTVTKFFSAVREFYCTIVETMVKTFPFQDTVLQTMSYLNPETKEKVTSEEIAGLADRFLTITPEQKYQLEDQAADYILSPKTDLPNFELETTLSNFWSDMENVKLPGGNLLTNNLIFFVN